jgi:DNA-binding response OmpR family regulator
MISASSMFDTRPYALIVERDEISRARITAALRESGFVAAAFRESRGALAALAVRPADIAIVTGQHTDDSDALATARQLRHCRPDSKVLFTGAADALAAVLPGSSSGYVVTRPFDKRRFLSAVFALLAQDGTAAEHHEEAELGLMAARIACLRSREHDIGGYSAARDIAHQIEARLAARRASYAAGENPPEAA